MDDTKQPKFSDYVKIEKLKTLIVRHLSESGLEDLMTDISDEDLNKLVYMMSQMEQNFLGTEVTSDKKIEMLSSYIICLWAMLIVSYKVPIQNL